MACWDGDTANYVALVRCVADTGSVLDRNRSSVVGFEEVKRLSQAYWTAIEVLMVGLRSPASNWLGEL